LKILHFADLHLGVESYGRTDPASGLSTRLQDLLKALDQVVEYTLGNAIDLVLFCGDAYKSREPSQTQQREFAKRIKRLSEAGIPVFLLTGNHDLPNAIGRATTIEIFDTLAIENVYVASHPDIFRIPTKSGTVQIIALPWLRRSALLSKDDTKNLDFNQINQKLQDYLTKMIADRASKLDPQLPAILAAHLWVMGASTSSEKTMTIGQEHMLLPGNIANPAFDYIALGHIHRHQVVHENPPVVYSGSLGRLDFGDEDDDKGFYVVEIEPNSEQPVTFEFHPVEGRRFRTINVNIGPNELDPTYTVLKAIAKEENELKEGIVRLNINLPAETGGQLRDTEIFEALEPAHYFTIAKETERETRMRLGSLTAEEITPLEALNKYLESNNVPPERAKTLLEYAEKLIKGETSFTSD